jgi:bacteriorhodopsin
MELPNLTIGEYTLVYNAFSFTFAAMFAGFIYFVLGRTQVSAKYRGALTMSALVVAVAGYHYLRIFESWSAAFNLETVDGALTYVASGQPFNDAYRYIDWLLTVPLLVAELVAVMALSRSQTQSLTLKLGAAAAAMVILGYPGEVAADDGTRALFGFLSTLPFVYLLYVLFTELGSAMEQQAEKPRVLIRNARLVLLLTWGFYPIVYMAPFLGLEGSAVTVIIQVGYCIADVAAKVGFGVLIYSIARAKMDAEGESLPEASGYVTAPATGD